MSVLSREEITKLAHLARLRFEDAELETINGQLNRILDYVEKLREVDVTGVEPAAHIQHVVNVMRDDVHDPRPVRDAMLAQAPDHEGPYFKVPRFVSEE